MGDPKKIRKKYSKPHHPWEKDRIDKEAGIMSSFALKNKAEIWKVNSKLKNFKNQAKKLGSLSSTQAEREKELLLKKLVNIGLLKAEDRVEAVLTLKLEDFLERRLQTIVIRKGFSKTMKQSRQFITHGHVLVNGKIITAPSYVVRKSEEGNVSFKQASSLADPEHPERQVAKPVEVVKAEEKS